MTPLCRYHGSGGSILFFLEPRQQRDALCKLKIVIKRPDSSEHAIALALHGAQIEELILEAAKGLPRDRIRAVMDRMGDLAGGMYVMDFRR